MRLSVNMTKPNSIHSFYEKTEVGNNGCWEWIGGFFNDGYPIFNIDNKIFRGHRWSYDNFVGKIPPGQQINHKCDNRICVNPNHLYVGTNQDNRDDMYKNMDKRIGNSKLTIRQALKIFKDNRTYKEIAEEYGISLQTVSAIKTGASWTTITGIKY